MHSTINLLKEIKVKQYIAIAICLRCDQSRWFKHHVNILNALHYRSNIETRDRKFYDATNVKTFNLEMLSTGWLSLMVAGSHHANAAIAFFQSVSFACIANWIYTERVASDRSHFQLPVLVVEYCHHRKKLLLHRWLRFYYSCGKNLLLTLWFCSPKMILCHCTSTACASSANYSDCLATINGVYVLPINDLRLSPRSVCSNLRWILCHFCHRCLPILHQPKDNVPSPWI